MTQPFDEYGDRRNPAILFLHGIRLGRAIWSEHARALSERYHVVTLDLPGHGALADRPFTLASVSELLDRTIDRVCESPPLIVGYSLGGFITMPYAARRPEMTSGLILAGCTLDFEGWKYWPYGVSTRLSEWLPTPLVEGLLDLGIHLSLPAPWAGLVSKIPFNREVLTDTDRLANNTRNSRVIRGYEKPVLFVNGEYDMVFRIDEHRYLKALPQAELRVLRGVEHSFPMRRAQEFTSIVGDFASRVFPAPAP